MRKWMLYYFICSLGIYYVLFTSDIQGFAVKLGVSLFVSAVILLASRSAARIQHHKASTLVRYLGFGALIYLLSLGCLLKIRMEYLADSNALSVVELVSGAVCLLIPPVALVIWILIRLVRFIRAAVLWRPPVKPLETEEQPDPFETGNQQEKVLILGIPAVVCLVCVVIWVWGFGLDLLHRGLLSPVRIVSEVAFAIFMVEVYLVIVIWINRMIRARNKYIRHAMKGDAK